MQHRSDPKDFDCERYRTSRIVRVLQRPLSGFCLYYLEASMHRSQYTSKSGYFLLNPDNNVAGAVHKKTTRHTFVKHSYFTSRITAHVRSASPILYSRECHNLYGPPRAFLTPKPPVRPPAERLFLASVHYA